MGMKQILVTMAAVLVVGCESILGPANATGDVRNGVEVWVCPNCDDTLGPQYGRFGIKVENTPNHRKGDGYYCKSGGSDGGVWINGIFYRTP